MSAPDTLIAALRYLSKSGPPPVYRASVGGEDARLDLDGEYVEHVVSLANARLFSSEFSLDTQGFCLVSHSSSVDDFYDEGAVKSIYEKEVASLVQAHTGADEIHVFDHTWRADSADTRSEKMAREPSAVIHNDYTDRSAAQRIRDIMPAERHDVLLSKRFAVINVWRAISHPAETSMLALCDARSIEDTDLVPTERRAKDRIGEIMMARYNTKHRWVYFPAMEPNEVLLLKTYDSATDGRARLAIHTAFDNPDVRPGALPRESLETRAFAFFE